MQHYQAADAQNADISSGFIMLIAGRAAFLRLLSARGRRGFPRPEPVAGGRWPEAGVGVGVNLPEGPPSLWHVGVCRRGEEVTLLFIFFFGAAFIGRSEVTRGNASHYDVRTSNPSRELVLCLGFRP